MSSWQSGKLDLKCSLNILRKALIHLMPNWEEQIKVDENGGLHAQYHGGAVKPTYHLLVSGNSGVPGLQHSDIGFMKKENGTWEIGGDYSVRTLQSKITGEVMRMRALTIARMRGYDVVRNESSDDEIITEIKVDIDAAKELL